MESASIDSIWELVDRITSHAPPRGYQQASPWDGLLAVYFSEAEPEPLYWYHRSDETCPVSRFFRSIIDTLRPSIASDLRAIQEEWDNYSR